MSRFHGLSAGNTKRAGSGGGGGGGGLVIPRHANPSASVRTTRHRCMHPTSTNRVAPDVVPVTGQPRPCPTPTRTGILAPSPMSKVKIGIVGSRFQADCIAGAVKAIPEEAELVAVASPTKGHAADFAKRHGIPQAFTDYRELLRDPHVEMISITAPNRLHAQITIDAARAGKHLVCEKPLCITLEEADAMIDACYKAGVLLLYAEELFFAPKYVKAKQLADEGAFGRVHLVKQGEKHSGPHSPWFWDVEQSGGGAVMDLGCHGIAFCWWFLGKPKVKSVYSQMVTQVHGDRTQGEDEAITIIEFENGATGMVESSWNRPGGMDDSIEVFGDKGQTYADMLMGNALPTYSEVGFGYAVEKAATTKGWTYPVFEEQWNYGFPQEMRHFARCVRGAETPIADGETGRVVQEVLYAAYASAGEGRKVMLPFQPKGVGKPIDLWKKRPSTRSSG